MLPKLDGPPVGRGNEMCGFMVAASCMAVAPVEVFLQLFGAGVSGRGGWLRAMRLGFGKTGPFGHEGMKCGVRPSLAGLLGSFGLCSEGGHTCSGNVGVSVGDIGRVWHHEGTSHTPSP